MKITQIEIRNFRSLAPDAENRTFSIDLTPGPNSLVGPNNCGKSNVIRALSLALDRSVTFNADNDLPQFIDKDQPGALKSSIEIEFSLPLRGSKENTLSNNLRRLLAARQGVEFEDIKPQSTVRLRVRYQKVAGVWQRDEDFIFSTKPKVKDVDPILVSRAIDAFYNCVYYIHLPAGTQTLPSAVWGIVYDGLKSSTNPAVSSVESKLKSVNEELSTKLVKPINLELTTLLRTIFPEVRAATVQLPQLDLPVLLGGIETSVTDSSSSGIDDKGTGVRTGYHLAILEYLAKAVSKSRSLIVTLDEPETFLHPGAQTTALRQLEGLANGLSVSLLYTTHSPYMISRSSKSTTFQITKSTEGKTRKVDSLRGNDQPSRLLGELFTSGDWTDALTNSDIVRPESRGVVIVEGKSDEVCLRAAIRVLKQEAFWSNIDIVIANGAKQMAVTGVLTASLHFPKPVIVLLDDDRREPRPTDEPLSRRAYKTLAGDLVGFTEKASLNRKPNQKHRLNGHVAYVWEALGTEPRLPYDLEDLFSVATITRFGKESNRLMVKRPGDLASPEIKKDFSNWIASRATPKDLQGCGKILQMLETRFNGLSQ